jgi:hypothetical protein
MMNLGRGSSTFECRLSGDMFPDADEKPFCDPKYYMLRFLSSQWNDTVAYFWGSHGND